MARWLRNHRERIDLVYLVGLGHEASVARRMLSGSRIPIIVRPDLPEDRDGRPASRWLVRRRCQAADAAIVADLAAARAVSAAGLPDDKIQLIPDGIRESVAEHACHRDEARRALAEVNPMLIVAAGAPVVVCAGRLRKGRGLLRLIEAWRPLSKKWSQARLWLVGDGPLREQLYAHLGDLDLRLSVAMPGSFDDLSDALAAANLLVEPDAEPTSPRLLLEAIALGVPVAGCHQETLQQTPALDAGTGRFASRTTRPR